jgi:hypothetical protein
MSNMVVGPFVAGEFCRKVELETMTGMMTKCASVTLLGALLLGSTTGCETKAGTGALVGGAAGAGIGAIIGHNSHGRTGSGAVIGGEMDKADRKKEEEDRYRDRAYAPPPPVYADTGRVTKGDVIAWTNRGMRDSEIIDRIDRSGTVYHLSAADENELRDSRVSEDVIREMKDTARH